jgi:hypothetical protein
VYNHATVDGGGIENAGDLTVESSVLSFNVARNGGAIDNDGGTATITGCTINGNQASGDGGGIYNEAAMTVTGCSFGGNVAQFGGALANSTRGTTTITDSIFVRNFAEFEGGALYTVRGGSLSVGTSEFTNNTPDHIFGDWNDLGGNIFH